MYEHKKKEMMSIAKVSAIDHASQISNSQY